MNKVKMNIWGREFEMSIIVKQFKGEDITEQQKEAVERIEMLESALNAAKPSIDKYVIETGLADLGVDKVDNIFKYVIPKAFYIPKCDKRTVAVMCNYKFDMEHGVAIVFEEEKLKTIGPQDVIL